MRPCGGLSRARFGPPAMSERAALVDNHCMRPLIGVTTSELRPSGAGTLRRQGEPAHPEMALGMTYLQALERAGAVPVVLPPCVSDLEALISRLDGVCLSGGPDLDPEAYGAPGCHPSHEVEVLPGTRLAGLIGAGPVAVNSFHHQAVDRLGSGLRVAARAADGTVEAIEGAGFVVAVQWHAEAMADGRLFEALASASAPGLRAVA